LGSIQDRTFRRYLLEKRHTEITEITLRTIASMQGDPTQVTELLDDFMQQYLFQANPKEGYQRDMQKEYTKIQQSRPKIEIDRKTGSAIVTGLTDDAPQDEPPPRSK
jgi:hypothetical protein